MTNKPPPPPREALVWLSARLADQLHILSTCCRPFSAPASSLLRVHVLDQRSAAGLLLLSWRCLSSASSHSHSQWLNASAVTLIERAADANRSLGRGAHEPPFEEENEDVQLFQSSSLGRVAVAKRALPVGACALRATAFAVVVSDRMAAKRCHWCFEQLAGRVLRCGACEYALYCSRACLDADAVLHDPQCSTLQCLQGVNTGSSMVDRDALRLALAVLQMEVFVGNTQALSHLHVPAAAVVDSGDRGRVLDQAARLLRRSLKKATTALRIVPRAHIRQTIVRIQTNAHPLHLSGAAGVCGLGLFPEAAMTLNHSCAPNVVPSFDPVTRSLGVYTVRLVASMELLEYSYLSDLAVGRTRRQQTLRDGFGFKCECSRCVDDTNALALDPDTSPKEEEEQQLVQQLLQLSGQSDALAVSGQLRILETRHRALLDARPDVAFSLQMLALRNATQTHDWHRVLAVAETLLRLWEAQQLPDFFPTTETLHQQVALAARRVGKTARALEAEATVTEIQRVCGFHAESSKSSKSSAS